MFVWSTEKCTNSERKRAAISQQSMVRRAVLKVWSGVDDRAEDLVLQWALKVEAVTNRVRDGLLCVHDFRRPSSSPGL